MTGFSWLPEPSILLALTLSGATSGALGCFAVLRRQSLLSDTLAHAALPGVCLAYLVTESKTPATLLTGALLAGLAGILLVLGLLSSSRLKQDAVLGIVLASSFGFGIVLLTLLRDRAGAGQTGLSSFIYGQAAYLTWDHVRLTLVLGGSVLALLTVFYKEFKLLAFDPEFTATLGFRRRLVELLLAALMAVTVIISLRIVGVVLTVSLLIAPAAAARQWTERLSDMILLAMGLGVLSACCGAFWSQNATHTPTGPAIVLVATVLLVVSLLFAPRRGLLWNWRRLRRHRRQVRGENLLTDFYRLGERAGAWDKPWPLTDLAGVRRQPPSRLRHPINELADQGLVAEEAGKWRLTDTGLREASRIVRNHRLWELYLATRLDLAADHVHRDAEAMEHALPPDVVAELEAMFQHPQRDPHGHAIPRPEQPQEQASQCVAAASVDDKLASPK